MLLKWSGIDRDQIYIDDDEMINIDNDLLYGILYIYTQEGKNWLDIYDNMNVLCGLV
jgi:hypothetical protein